MINVVYPFIIKYKNCFPVVMSPCKPERQTPPLSSGNDITASYDLGHLIQLEHTINYARSPISSLVAWWWMTIKAGKRWLDIKPKQKMLLEVRKLLWLALTSCVHSSVSSTHRWTSIVFFLLYFFNGRKHSAKKVDRHSTPWVGGLAWC